MQAAILVILLSFCAILALPVPVEKNDESRVEREISFEELQSELEDIENRVDAVRTKVKEDSEENDENTEKTTGISPTQEPANVQSTENPGKGQVVIEKITPPSASPKLQPNVESVAVQVEKVEPSPTGASEKEDKEKKPSEVEVEKIASHEEGTSQAAKEVTVSVEKISPGRKSEEELEGDGEKELDEEEEEKASNPVEGRTQATVEKLPSGTDESGNEKNKLTVSVEKIPVEEKTGAKPGGEVGNEEEKKERVTVVSLKEVENEKREKSPDQASVKRITNNQESNDEEIDLAAVASDEEFSSAKEKEKAVQQDATNDERVNTRRAVRVRVEKVADAVEPQPKAKADEPREFSVKKLTNDEAEDEEEVTEVKETREKKTFTVEKVQEASEEQDLRATVDKLPKEEPLVKETPAKSDKKITATVEKIQSSTVSDETDEASKPKVKVTEITEASAKTTAGNEKQTSGSPSRPEAAKVSVVKIEKMSPEEKDLENRNEVTAEVEKFPAQAKRSKEILEDASKNTEKSQDEDEELEADLEKELETEQETPEERKIALEFEKALEEERKKKQNVKPPSPAPAPVTAKPHEATTEELLPTKPAPKKESGKEPRKQSVKSENDSKRGMTAEERELAELAEKALNDENEEGNPATAKKTAPPPPRSPTQNPTTRPTTAGTTIGNKVTTEAAEAVVRVSKIEKEPKITVTVIKEKNEKLLGEKETELEEKKLREELAKEIKQEKLESPSVLLKITKVTEKPAIKPTTEKVQEKTQVKLEKKDPELELEQEQEDELEDKTGAKK